MTEAEEFDIKRSDYYCIVLLQAHLLSEVQKCFIASKAVKAQALLIYVVPRLHPQELSIRIHDTSLTEAKTLQVLFLYHIY
jgi:hypothetical protein